MAALPLIVLFAAYGSGNFTQLTQSLVKNDALTVAAENSIFTDPWVGYLKTLVVVYRFGTYKPFMSLVQEHQTLSIALGPQHQVDWDRKSTSGLTIIGAAYGITDVTAKVQSKVVNDGLTLSDLDNTLGDGWPGHPESLVICYQYSNDPAGGIVVRTDASVRLQGPQLTILGAVYGLEDVTVTVQGLVGKQDGARLDVTVSNTVFKENWTGVSKTLVIVYQYKDFAPQVAIAKDGESLSIAYQTQSAYLSAPASSTELQILGAAYGPQDVSTKVKARVVNNHLTVDAGNRVFGNTWAGNRKALVVVYRVGTNTPQIKIAPDVNSLVNGFKNYIDI